MKFLFLSDLHLGSPLFVSKSKILELLNGDYDRIFILGDLLDIWEEKLEDILSDNIEIINKLRTLTNVVIIKGNHDPAIIRLESVFPKKNICYSFNFNIGDKRCLLAHGDEFDSLIRHYSWLAKIFWPIGWAFERIGINLKGFFRTLFYSISAKIQKKYYNDLVLDIEKNMVEKYENDYDYIIVGHTHLPKINKENGFTYINCGDWVHNKSYVEFVDSEFKLTEL